MITGGCMITGGYMITEGCMPHCCTLLQAHFAEGPDGALLVVVAYADNSLAVSLTHTDRSPWLSPTACSVGTRCCWCLGSTLAATLEVWRPTHRNVDFVCL